MLREAFASVNVCVLRALRGEAGTRCSVRECRKHRMFGRTDSLGLWKWSVSPNLTNASFFSNEIKKENFARIGGIYFQLTLSVQSPSQHASSVDEDPPLLSSLYNTLSRHKIEFAEPAGSKLRAFSKQTVLT